MSLLQRKEAYKEYKLKATQEAYSIYYCCRGKCGDIKRSAI